MWEGMQVQSLTGTKQCRGFMIFWEISFTRRDTGLLTRRVINSGNYSSILPRFLVLISHFITPPKVGHPRSQGLFGTAQLFATKHACKQPRLDMSRGRLGF